MPDLTTTTSTAPSPRASSALPLYISPVISKLDADSRPNPSPACETCPASLWYTTQQGLQCYCSRMHLIVWGAKEHPVLSCDGRELALIEYMEKADQAG